MKQLGFAFISGINIAAPRKEKRKNRDKIYLHLPGESTINGEGGHGSNP